MVGAVGHTMYWLHGRLLPTSPILLDHCSTSHTSSDVIQIQQERSAINSVQSIGSMVSLIIFAKSPAPAQCYERGCWFVFVRLLEP